MYTRRAHALHALARTCSLWGVVHSGGCDALLRHEPYFYLSEDMREGGGEGVYRRLCQSSCVRTSEDLRARNSAVRGVGRERGQPIIRTRWARGGREWGPGGAAVCEGGRAPGRPRAPPSRCTGANVVGIAEGYEGPEFCGCRLESSPSDCVLGRLLLVTCGRRRVARARVVVVVARVPCRACGGRGGNWQGGGACERARPRSAPAH